MSFEPLIPVGLSPFNGDGEREDEQNGVEAIPVDETQTSGSFWGFDFLQIDVGMLMFVWMCALSMPVRVAAHPCMHVRPTVPCYIL